MSTKDKAADLEKLSVKELIRQAARKNVPLTQISAAVEKADLINLIIRAGPVMDTYDVSIGVKVHTAESIAKHGHVKSKKVKKKRRKRSSSSSNSRSSHSSRSCMMTTRSLSRGRRKKKSKSRHRSKSRGRKRSRSRRHGRSRSRSPSLVIVREQIAARGAGAALPDLVPPPDLPTLALPPMVPTTAAGTVDMPVQLKALPPASAQAAEAVAPEDRTIAQAGMAAAAAMGFDVLPKAPITGPSAPAAGLRPTINSVAPVPYGAALMPGGRVCIQYLCNSRCDLGTNCPEAHIIDPEEEMRVRARFKEQECHYGSQCTRSGCLFRHPGEKFEEGQLIPEGQQVSLRVTPQGMALDFM